MRVPRLVVVVALISAMLAAIGTPATAAPYNEPEYVGSIGHPGRAGVYAWGMATAPNGNVIVGDYWNYQMHEYTIDGTLVNTFGSRGEDPGENNAPHGVAINPVDGSVYVSDLNNGRINHFAADGTWIEDLSTFAMDPTTFEVLTVPFPYAPRLAFDNTGVSYMISSHTTPPGFVNRIIIRDSDWNVLGHIGEPGQFGVLRGIATAPDGRVYTVDAGQAIIRVFERDTSAPGVVYNQLPSFGSGFFSGDARGIVVDDDNGWVYVVDAFDSQIEKFDLDGNHLLTWGSEGTGPGQFRDGGREVTLAPDPRPGFESAPPVVAVADFGNNRVNVYDSEGTSLWFFPDPPLPPPDDGFNQLQDVAASPGRDTVFTADTFNHRVQKFTASTGEFETVWGFRGSSAPFAMNYPRGIAVDPDNGDVWLSNTREGDIQVYDEDGNFRFRFGTWGDGPNQNDYARGIDVEAGADGRVLIADTGNKRISIHNKDGSLITNVPCAPNSPEQLLSGCTDVAVADDGRFFGASIAENVVYRYSANGNLQGSFGQGILRGAYGLAIYDGRVYVSEAWNHRISVFEFDGTFVDSFGSLGDGDGEFEQPKGIDIADGFLYVADHFNERVQVFDLTGDGGGEPGPDVINPSATVAAPAAGGTVPAGAVQIGGTADDNVGVAGVAVAIQDTVTKQWLQSNGTWGSFNRQDAVLDTPGAASTDWAHDVTLPGGTYGVSARVTDTSGNAVNASWHVFTVDEGGGGGPDDVDPSLSVDSPAAGASVPSGAVQLSGTAADNIGVANVRIALQNTTTRQWLQPSGTWGSFSLIEAVLDAPDSDAVNWTHDVTLPAGSYGFTTRAIDTSGNETRASWRSFSTTGGGGGPDVTDPSVALDFPVSGSDISAGDIELAGIAADNVGIDSVQVAVQNSSTRLWLQPGGGWGSFNWQSAELDAPGSVSVIWTHVVNLPAGNFGISLRATDTSGNRTKAPWSTFSAS